MLQKTNILRQKNSNWKENKLEATINQQMHFQQGKMEIIMMIQEEQQENQQQLMNAQILIMNNNNKSWQTKTFMNMLEKVVKKWFR